MAADTLIGPKSLAVVCYHRVDEPQRTDLYPDTVSARPEVFEAHLDAIEDQHTPVALSDVVDSVRSAKPLPPRAALITFDDGYRDNYEVAYPILKRRGIPAVIFLASDHISSTKPFWWDLASFLLHHTERTEATIPLLGERLVPGPGRRRALLDEWLGVAKTVPEKVKLAALEEMESGLGVSPRPDDFADVHLTWDQVREMGSNGMAFGGHTCTHPILTRVDSDQARSEIFGSVTRIREETGDPVSSFAYPNGLQEDFDDDIEQITQEAGLDISFSLIPGPSRLGEVRKRPFAVRRIYVGLEDTPERFARKLAGAARVRATLHNIAGSIGYRK